MDPRIERLIALLKASSDRAQQLAALLKQFTTDMERATSTDLAQRAAKTLQGALGRIIEQEQKDAAEGIEIAHQLGEAAPAPPAPERPVRAEDIAKHFRALVDTIQLDARRPSEGELATTLKSFDVELKGLIVVDDKEARVVTPAPGAVDPGQLSTIRMSFGSIPALTVRDTGVTEPIR